MVCRGRNLSDDKVTCKEESKTMQGCFFLFSMMMLMIVSRKNTKGEPSTTPTCSGGVCLPSEGEYKSSLPPVRNTTVLIHLDSDSTVRRVDDHQMTVTLDAKFWVTWEDPRLNVTGDIVDVPLDPEFAKRLWFPPLWASNLKSSQTKSFMVKEAIGECR